MAAARKPARKAPAAEAEKADPGTHENPSVVETVDAPHSDPARKPGVYVAVDQLSWRPHPLAHGTEVSDVLPASVLEQCLADGRVVRETR